MTFFQKFFINLVVLSVAITVFLAALESGVRVAGLEKSSVYNWGTKGRIMRVSENSQIGLELIPESRGRVIGVDVSISKDGLRDRVFPKAKPDGVKRIITIGDSITFGYGVKRSEIYAKRLEKFLNEKEPGKWEVINFGVPGVNSSQYVSNLIKRGFEYEPDYVVIGYCLNDVDPPAMNIPDRMADGTVDIDAFQDRKRSRLHRTGTQIMAWEIPVPQILDETLADYSVLYRVVSQRWDILLNRYGLRHNKPVIGIEDTQRSWYHYFNDVATKYETAQWDIVKSDMTKLKSALDDRGVEALAVIFPFQLEIRGEYPYQPIHDKVNDYFQSIKIPVIDMKSVYNSLNLSPDKLWVGGFDMIHPKPKGHQAAAEAIGGQILLMENKTEFTTVPPERILSDHFLDSSMNRRRETRNRSVLIYGSTAATPPISANNY